MEVKLLMEPESGFSSCAFFSGSKEMIPYLVDLSILANSFFPSSCKMDIAGIQQFSICMEIIPASLLQMIAAAAPASQAFLTFSSKVISPRLIRAIFPFKRLLTLLSSLVYPKPQSTYLYSPADKPDQGLAESWLLSLQVQSASLPSLSSCER